jgi:hypothetical protein
MIVEYAMLGFTINQIVPHVTRQTSSSDCSRSADSSQKVLYGDERRGVSLTISGSRSDMLTFIHRQSEYDRLSNELLI